MKYLKISYKLFESEINDIIEKCKKYKIKNYEIDDDGLLNVYEDVIIEWSILKFIPFKFKEIWGDFDISYSNFESLMGSPQTIHGNFNFINIKIKDLKHCPKEVNGDFWGGENKNLRYFIEFPICVKNNICFENCILKNLYGVIDCVYGDFYINNNKSLKSLKYGPKHVDGYYNCSFCGLTTLYGAPKYVGGGFNCKNNRLISLKYSPKYNGRSFIFGHNNIKSFDYFPEYVGGGVYCDYTPVYEIWKLFEDKDQIEYFNQMRIIKGDTVNIKKLNLFLKSIGKEPVESVKGYINI